MAREPRTPVEPSREPYRPGDRIVAIGSSTGGVEALTAVIGAFPANGPPTVITQHMPATFTASFAARLDRGAACQVAEARDGDVLQVGKVLLAPGGTRHMAVRRLGDRLVVRLEGGDPVSGHRPSVDVLLHSVAQAVGSRAVGALLTGMGRDGAEGLLAMRRAGATTIGQDESTSIVFGMPRVAAEIGAVERQLPLNRVGPGLLRAAAAKMEGAA
jgi:two-component system chemotaxis response regulator CheB